jgi:hypothetical protein
VNGVLVSSATTDAELGFVSGVTSGIQAQINGISPSSNPAITEPGNPVGAVTDYFEISHKFFPTSSSTTAVWADSGGNPTNLVGVWGFYLSQRITVAKLVFEVTTLQASQFWYAGIYSANGNTLLVNSGQQSTAAAGIKVVTLGTPVTLNRGTYWLAFNGSSTVMRFRFAVAFTVWTNILNQDTIHQGIAANSVAAGALPATLGTIRLAVSQEGASGGVPIFVLQS